MNGQYKQIPWGTIIFVLIIIGGLYALYPSNDVAGGKTPSAVTALLYAVGVVVGLGVLILGWFLFRPKWKEKKEKPETVEQKKLPPKVTKGDNYTAEKVVAAIVLLIGLFLFWNSGPYQACPPVPSEEMLYVPLFGLCRAVALAGFIALMWSFFVETDTTNAAIFAICLTLGGLGILFLSLRWYWFAPFGTDPLVPMSWVLGGVVGIVVIIHALTKNIEYTTIALITVVAVWLPQFAAKSPALMALTHAVFQ